jgi:hypothetical protein
VRLKVGEIIAQKHVELIGIINKPLLLHLFGCLLYPFMLYINHAFHQYVSVVIAAIFRVKLLQPYKITL